jgi:chromate reductase
MNKNILAISGSIRKNSSNDCILNAIKDNYSAILDVHLYNELATLPHFDPDPNITQLPSPVMAFRELIAQADGVIICSPEYVFSLPAVLKNALEWCVATTVFTGKPVACIIASGLGEKAYEQLLLIMRTLQAKVEESAAIVFQGVRGKIDSTGKINDEKTLRNIDMLIQSFITMMDEHKTEPD